MIKSKLLNVFLGIIFLTSFVALCVKANNSVSVPLDEKSCVALLPKKLSEQLDLSYKGWKVLELSDLIEDDKTLWTKTWGNKHCPGVAVGDFKGQGKNSYAVALIRKAVSSATAAQKLLFGEEGDGIYRVSELTQLNDAPLWVVKKGPPGQYAYFYDRSKKVQVKTETVMYMRLEAGAIAYYFNGKAFERILVSD